MTAYEIIFNTIQERVYNGELSFEDGEILNEMAYDRYTDNGSEYEESAYEEYLDNMVDDIYDESTRFAREIDKQEQNYGKAFDKAEDILRPYKGEYNKRMNELERMRKNNPAYNDDPAYKIKSKEYDTAFKKYYNKKKELHYDDLLRKARTINSINSKAKASKFNPEYGRQAKNNQREMFDLYPAKEKPARPELKEYMTKKQIKDLTKTDLLSRRVK